MAPSPTATLPALAVLAGLALHARADSSVVFGNVRVQALSPTLIRVEPKGPMGFEDRSTFVATNRSSFTGLDITTTSNNGTNAVFATSAYIIEIRLPPPPPPFVGCTGTQSTDLAGAKRISSCPLQAKSCLSPGATQQDCCENCTMMSECTAWIYDPRYKNCWLMATGGTPIKRSDRISGGNYSGGGDGSGVNVEIFTPDGSAKLYSTDDSSSVSQNLEWPAPNVSTAGSAYALKDYPRFYAPPWGPTPIPDDAKPSVDPALMETNGYDYRNNVNGDIYIFLLGSTIEEWATSRREFIQLAGPTPALPDYAFGTWFTYWHQYSEDEAKGEVERWHNDDLPIDIWALDMNWRQSPHGNDGNYKPDENHFYNFPNTKLFPDFAGNGTGWFDWLMSKGIRTYFNDHPFPTNNGTALQTTPDEVNFRWNGLSDWLARGLTFWWFDANWAFSIPPPNVPYGGHGDGAAWDGMDNRVWGSHLYYTTVKIFNENNPDRQHTLPPMRPMALTKYADENMRPGLVQHQHPAQHRYPVWWTGDGVSLEASVESMVDSGVYDFKPYVHSDCGGDYRPPFGGDLLRWTAHCAFGSIHRFHGAEHQPWSYTNHTEDVIRNYLKTRYSMAPSLVAAGHVATETAFPLVARCDLFWPDYPNATSNHQYLFLNETLVAPIWNSITNETSRDVWIPPGEWVDAWSGSVIQGPQSVSVTQPYERQPMWHRSGGFVITAPEPGNRIDDQDWSELTVHAFPSTVDSVTSHPLFEQNDASSRTILAMASSAGKVRFEVSPLAQTPIVRAWSFKLHLRAGQSVISAVADDVLVSSVTHTTHAQHFFPFGNTPPPSAGPVATIRIPPSSTRRIVEIVVE